MPYSIQLPDGTLVENIPDEIDPSTAKARIIAQHPELGPKPKTGIGAAVSKGVESIISSGRTAFGTATGDAEEAARAGLERGEALGRKYADQVSLQKVKDAYNKDGVLSAAGEALSQIPAALAEQAPNLAAMAGSARLGATAGSFLGPVGATVGGIGGALLPSLIQQFGGNVERQAAEQQKAGRPLSIDVGAAGAAALPQAGLDVASSLIPLGGRLVQKLTGIPMGALLSRSAEGAAKLADERLLTVLAKGVGVGALAEIPTEVAQQMLERAQAGLSLSSPDALKEYGETAYQVGLLAPLGAVGRLSERGGARAQVEQKTQEEAAQAAAVQQQQANVAAQQKATDDANPEYAIKLRADYVAANVEMQRLNQAVKALSAEKDPLSVADAKDARIARDTYAKETMQPLVDEIRRVRQLHPGFDFRPPAPVAPVAPVAIAAVPAIPTAVAPDAVESAVTPPPTTVTPMPEATVAATKQGKKVEGAAVVSEPAPFTAPARMDEINSYVESIMGSPEVAAEMVASNEQIPGLTPEENAIFLETLQQRLAQEELTGVTTPAVTETEVAPVTKTKGKKAAGTEPTVTRAAPPTDPDTMWSPTVTLDYGAYTIENDGQYPTYSFKTPLAVTPQAALQQLRVTEDRAHLLFTNQKGDKVKVSVAPDHIRLENQATGGLQDYDFGSGKDNPTLTALFGADLLAQLNSTAVENRLPTFLSSLTQRLGLANLDRFTQEYADMLGGKPLAAKTKGKKAAAPVTPAVEDTTVEPTEPKTLEQAFATTQKPKEIPVGSQYMIPGAAPLNRTRAVQTQELTQEIQTELKQLSKAYIEARQEGRRPDALAIIDRMRYLKDQAAQGRAAKVRPVWEGAAGTKESETIETQLAERTSSRALQQDIARAQALPNLSDTNAELLDKLQQNLPALLRYKAPTTGQIPGLETIKTVPEAARGLGDTRVRIVDFIDSLRQGLPAETEARNLQQQLAQIERQSQQEVSPRELQGMLAKAAKLPLSNKEKGLVRLVGENQSTIMEDPAARMAVARWLSSDVGQGIGDATQDLRKYFGVAEETQNYKSPVGKATSARAKDIASEYARAVSALDGAYADASVPLQPLANNIARMKVQLTKVKKRVETATAVVAQAQGAAKRTEQTKLTTAQDAYASLEKQISAAETKYRTDLTALQTAPGTAEKIAAAKTQLAEATKLKSLQDTLLDSERTRDQGEVQKALDKARPLNVQAETKAEAPTEVKTSEMQEDMFPAERKQETERENTRSMYEGLFNEPKPAVAAARTKKQEESRKERKLTGDLSALPGKQISFERRRAMLDAIDDAPVKRQALEDAANNDNLSQEAYDAAQAQLTAYLAKLRKKAADKDKSYATAYRLRGEESEKVQNLKKQAEAPGLTDAKRKGLQTRFKKAQDQLNKRDEQLARLRGVEIETIETPEQRSQTLDTLFRETYGQAVSEEQQTELDKNKGRALGAVMRTEVFPATVFYSGEERSLKDTEKRTYTRPDMRLTETRGEKQRDVPITKKEMAAANAAAPDATMGPAPETTMQALRQEQQLFEIAQKKVDDLGVKLANIKERVALVGRSDSKVRKQAVVDKLAAEQRSTETELAGAKADAKRLADQENKNTETLLEETQARVKDLRAKVVKSKKSITSVTDAIAAGKQITGTDGKPVDLKEIKNRLEKLLKERETALADAIKDVRFYKTDLSYQADDLAYKKVQVAGEVGETKLSEAAKSKTQMLRGTSGPNDTPLSANNIDLLGSNKLAAVLTNISEKSSNHVARRIAGKLAAVVEVNDVNVKLVEVTAEDSPDAPGSTSRDGNRVRINENTGLSEETVVHEAAHAATMFELDKPDSALTPNQRKAKEELNRMRDSVLADKNFDNKVIKDGDLHEFVAEGLASRAVQTYMRGEQWEGRSLWQRFKDGVLRLIGVNTPAKGPMLDRFLDLAENFIAAKAENAPSVEKTKLRSVGFLLSPKDVKYANSGLAAAGVIGDTFIAKERGVIDRVRAASGGWLGQETMLVDRFAPLERLSKGMEALKGSQMMYYLRMYDQRMNFTAQSVANGAIQRVAKQRKDGRTEYVVESVDGANIQQVVDILKKAPAGSPDAANRLFTMYLAGIRAKNKGFQTLHFGDALTEAQLDSAMMGIRATPGLEENFKQARDVYNEYNRNMVGFLEQSGAISKAHAARLTKENDYIPFYREQDGVALLAIGGETPIRIGSIAEQPYLHELVGGDRPILDFLTSSVQNTALITDMGLRNLATKNSMNELKDIGLAQIRPGPGTADSKVVRFKVDGADYHAIVDTDKAGVPADLLVKGMQGIPTQLSMLFRALSFPSTLLRRAVTLSPTYAARQIFRDSLAAPLLSGADFVPVLGALKEIGKSATKSTLDKRGITGGQVFAGGSSSEAMTKILNDMLTGKGNLGQLISKAEALNMEADAATRRAQYNSYIKQGLSEMEATLLALESMNFNKRGASPSIHMANALIPFFNSQIQGLNVLYKALTGKLPFDKRLKIQEKLITRGALMFGASLAYAAMMQDDEAYKNATPEQKYGNWFVRISGIDEPIKVPIPFEVGYLFKALPEAIYNSLANEHGSEEAFKALNTIILQTLPGGTSMATVPYKGINIPITPPIPQALKPGIEVALGKSFYTGRDILSRSEQQVLPEKQFRESSNEISKMLGSGLGLSPIKIEALVSGYTGTMGLALMQVLSMGVPTGESPEKTTKRLSDMPVIGSSFQPNDAGGIINAVYERMNDVKKVKTTVDRMLSEGRVAEAKELISQRSEEFAQSGVADYFTSHMQQITKYENAIRASNLTGDEKQAKLAEMRQLKIRLAETVRQATDAAKKVD